MTRYDYDYVIVGSGLFGATFAHLMHARGRHCLVIDKRRETGGNIRCRDMEGIHVHQYGAHIFHTANRSLWEFVNRLTPFNRFTNSPLARYEDKFYNLPFNMNTFRQMWGVTTPEEARATIERQREAVREELRRAGVSQPRHLAEQARLLVGDDIFRILIKGYTEKQWGRPCEQLPAFIIRRLPVRLTYDNNYFNDPYQGIPEQGYNTLIDRLLSGIEARTGEDFFANRQHWAGLAPKLVFSGPIDEFYEYRLGRLPYRSLRFEHEMLPVPNFQGNAVVNYTERQVPYTRIIEHKHFDTFGEDVYAKNATVITREYPVEWTAGMEPYYPINDESTEKLAQQYRELARGERNVIFGGRLAEYRYYDMAPVIQRAMEEADRETASPDHTR